MRKSCLYLLVCLGASSASLAHAAAAAVPEKKLIEFGWDEPDTAFMRAHVADLERTPFDGCVFHVEYRRPDGSLGNFTWEAWGTRAFTADELQPALDNLKATRFEQFRHNFLRFNTTPAKLDWFDDPAALLNNARHAARLAREGGCRGILFDIEQYEGPLFNYRKQRDAATKSWEVYAVRARERGRQVMEAFQEGFPDVAVFLTFGYCLPWAQTGGDPGKLAQADYGLLAPFLDGMVAAARSPARLIDGHELSYSYKENAQFERAARTLRQGLLPIVDDARKYAEAFTISFGLWLDHGWRERPWNVQDLTQNYFTPEALEANARRALEWADEYAWIYSETPRWWTQAGPPEKLPAPYDAALRRAKVAANARPGSPPSTASASSAVVLSNSVAALLRRPILDSNLPIAEVQAYAEQRVPVLPVVSTLAEWERRAEAIRRDVLDQVVFRGAAAAWRTAPAKVDWLETIEGGPGYRIRKLRYEAVPGLWIPALLYEPDALSGPVPVVLNVNGHEGVGKSVPYKQIRCINQARRGMLALNPEWLGMGQLRGPGYAHSRMNQLDLCGASGLAVFYLAMSRGLDVLLAHAHADPARVAVAGLSGGGWQTIFLSSLDPRVRLSNPVAGYSSFRTRARFLEDLGDSEQTPCDLATVADYTHLTALRAPRPTLLTYNAKDNCCFAAAHALPPLVDAAQPYFRLYGCESHFRTHVNFDPGDHNFGQENREALYRMLGEHFYAGQPFDAREIPCESEVKSNAVLTVALPANNADFHSLALVLARDLPRNAELPATRAALEQWQASQRARLRAITRAHHAHVMAERVGSEDVSDVRAVFWRFKVDDGWTLPATELARGTPQQTVILVSDLGRAGAVSQALELLESRARVLAVDPFYFGESKLRSHDYLFALLLAAVGERPLGVQAGQLAALARWARDQYKSGPVRLVAAGPRASVFALVAAGLEPDAIGSLELREALGSLKEILENDWTVTERPELFCFGLLEAFDVPQLLALVTPRAVDVQALSPAGAQALDRLPAWHTRMGGVLRMRAAF